MNHLHLHVSNVDEAADFYRQWFGFTFHVQHGPIVFLRDDGGLDLALAPDDTPHDFPSWFHFAFRCCDPDGYTIEVYWE